MGGTLSILAGLWAGRKIDTDKNLKFFEYERKKDEKLY
jgi:hypothetical protein